MVARAARRIPGTTEPKTKVFVCANPLFFMVFVGETQVAGHPVVANSPRRSSHFLRRLRSSGATLGFAAKVGGAASHHPPPTGQVVIINFPDTGHINPTLPLVAELAERRIQAGSAGRRNGGTAADAGGSTFGSGLEVGRVQIL